MHDEQLPVRSLREWRTQVFFRSQEEFAKDVGTNATTISLWETGARVPQFSKKRQVAERLGLKPEQIAWPEAKSAATKAA